MDRPTRSHPTLHPLTTLPPSPSYLYPTTSIPTTPSLLSRPSSQTRLRPSRSTPTAVVVTPTTNKNNLSGKKSNKSNDKLDKLDRDDWLTRTASALTMERLEEKGLAWRAKRESSTSLTGEDGDGDGDWGASGRVKGKEGGKSRGQSRGQSRAQSRAQSRRGSTGDGMRSEPDVLEEDIMPDFVNAEEEEEGEEEEGEDVDEGEMKRVVLGRVGGWVDWAVGWMDFRTEEDEEEEGGEGEGAAEVEDKEAVVKGELDPVELQKRLRRKKKRGSEVEETGSEGVSIVSGAPEQAGFWSDARWLLGVASKVAL